MKLFLDFFPLVVFVGIYFYSGAENPMYPAVMGLMIASVIQTVGSRLLTGHFEKLHLWTLLITLVLGAMTLVFRDAAFVQWKASVIVWLMAAIFLYRQFILKKLFIQEMLGAALEDNIQVPDKIWRSVNLIWPISYILFGFLNLYIAYYYSEAFWVKFKLFGLMGLTVSLLIYTMVRLFPYFPKENEENTSSSDNSSITNIKDKDQ